MAFKGPVRIFYQDETLTRYEAAVQHRLRQLMELLAADPDANLQYDKRVWHPDDNAVVEFTLMEGITDPIIVVNVRYAEPPGGAIRKEKKKYYSPYLWVGIKAINQVTIAAGENPNCGLAGFPVIGQLIGFEPRIEDAENPFQASVATATRRGPIGLSIGDDELPFNDAVADCDWNTFTDAPDFFGDQSWFMSGTGFSGVAVVARSESGMIATEFCSTKLTLPPQALQPTEAGGEPLHDQYWDRSIIVNPDGHTIFDPSIHDNPQTFRYELPEEQGVTLECTFVEHTIPCEVLSGTYEIQAWAESYICECWGAELHLRMVLGKEARTEDIVYDVETGKIIEFVPGMEPSITVVDIYPDGVGHNNDNTRGFLIREILLGGQGPCADEGNFGSFNPGRGFWQESILVDVNNGGWSLSDQRSVVPPLTDESCADSPRWNTEECIGACDPGPFTGATFAPATWDLGAPGGVAATLYQFTARSSDGNFYHFDMLKLISFHLARVTAVNPVNGNICGIQLVGNDGGQGNCGDCKPFGYGTVFNNAKGARGLVLGEGYDPSAVAQGGWAVGELVVVTHAGGVAEPFSLAQTGIIVQPANDVIPGTGGLHPLSEFAAHTYRCPQGQAVEQAFRRYEEALAGRYINEGTSSPIRGEFSCQSGRAAFVST